MFWLERMEISKQKIQIWSNGIQNRLNCILEQRRIGKHQQLNQQLQMKAHEKRENSLNSEILFFWFMFLIFVYFLTSFTLDQIKSLSKFLFMNCKNINFIFIFQIKRNQQCQCQNYGIQLYPHFYILEYHSLKQNLMNVLFQLLKGLRQEYTCSIYKKTMEDPYVDKNGISYDKQCILQNVNDNKELQNLVPNLVLNNLIQKIEKNLPIAINKLNQVDLKSNRLIIENQQLNEKISTNEKLIKEMKIQDNSKSIQLKELHRQFQKLSAQQLKRNLSELKNKIIKKQKNQKHQPLHKQSTQRLIKTISEQRLTILRYQGYIKKILKYDQLYKIDIVQKKIQKVLTTLYHNNPQNLHKKAQNQFYEKQIQQLKTKLKQQKQQNQYNNKASQQLKEWKQQLSNYRVQNNQLQKQIKKLKAKLEQNLLEQQYPHLKESNYHTKIKQCEEINRIIIQKNQQLSKQYDELKVKSKMKRSQFQQYQINNVIFKLSHNRDEIFYNLKKQLSICYIIINCYNSSIQSLKNRQKRNGNICSILQVETRIKQEIQRNCQSLSTGFQNTDSLTQNDCQKILDTYSKFKSFVNIANPLKLSDLFQIIFEIQKQKDSEFGERLQYKMYQIRFQINITLLIKILSNKENSNLIWNQISSLKSNQALIDNDSWEFLIKNSDKYPNVDTIRLENTSVTNIRKRDLQSFKNLKWIDVTNNNIKSSSIQQLQQYKVGHPDVVIYYYDELNPLKPQSLPKSISKQRIVPQKHQTLEQKPSHAQKNKLKQLVKEEMQKIKQKQLLNKENIKQNKPFIQHYQMMDAQQVMDVEQEKVKPKKLKQNLPPNQQVEKIRKEVVQMKKNMELMFLSMKNMLNLNSIIISCYNVEIDKYKLTSMQSASMGNILQTNIQNSINLCSQYFGKQAQTKKYTERDSKYLKNYYRRLKCANIGIKPLNILKQYQLLDFQNQKNTQTLQNINVQFGYKTSTKSLLNYLSDSLSFQECSQIKHIKSSTQKINQDDWLKLIANHNRYPYLKTMSLQGNCILDAKKDELTLFKELSYVDLSSNPLSKQSINELKKYRYEKLDSVVVKFDRYSIAQNSKMIQQ